MATWDDVERACLALPDTTESTRHGGRGWAVGNRPAFVWERPLRRAELTELGDAAPAGAVLAVRCADLEAKEVLLTEESEVCFTVTHFAGYPAVLVRLEELPLDLLTELATEGWLARAPKRLIKAHPELTSETRQ